MATTDTPTLPVLDGTPVGTGATVVCDTCNATIVRGRPDLRPDDGDPTHGYLLATEGTGMWYLRWVTCEDCGPVDDRADADDGEVLARCEFGYAKTRRGGTHVVACAHVAPDVEQTGDVSALQNGGP